MRPGVEACSVSTLHPELLPLAIVGLFVLFWFWPKAPQWAIVVVALLVCLASWALSRR